MRDNLTLDFPVLTASGDDFVAQDDASKVSYVVEAKRDNKNVTITHTLTGNSFIRERIMAGSAEFSALLVYLNSSERQHHSCNTYKAENDALIAVQTIANEFSYAPVIMPSIFSLKDEQITAGNALGVSKFWHDTDFHIPKYARIARHPKLVFTDGGVSSLFRLKREPTFEDGQMEVVVDEDAGEGRAPVTLCCAKDIYAELKKISRHKDPRNAIESMRLAIATQALSSTYAYMHELTKSDDYDPQQVARVLTAHLEMMQEQEELDWHESDFKPSLAATMMMPYYVKAVHDDNDDE